MKIEELEQDLTAWRELALKSTAALVESGKVAKEWQELYERCQKMTDELLKIIRPAADEPKAGFDEQYRVLSRWVN